MAKKKPASEESADAKPQEAEENNQCFIITPIGDEISDIRRATDGLIDAVIEPVVNAHGMTALAPHRDYDPRSITRRIVENVVESRLVIANLTGLNPNVMYELAVRHAAGNPIVAIAEEGTRLPFDIKDELTVFYRNDMQGVVDLRSKLNKAIRQALSATKSDNPIVRYRQEALIELKGDPPEAIWLVMNRLDSIEKRLTDSQSRQHRRSRMASDEAEEDRMEFYEITGENLKDKIDACSTDLAIILNHFGIPSYRFVSWSPNMLVVGLTLPHYIFTEEGELALRDALNDLKVPFDSIRWTSG